MAKGNKRKKKKNSSIKSELSTSRLRFLSPSLFLSLSLFPAGIRNRQRFRPGPISPREREKERTQSTVSSPRTRKSEKEDRGKSAEEAMETPRHVARVGHLTTNVLIRNSSFAYGFERKARSVAVVYSNHREKLWIFRSRVSGRERLFFFFFLSAVPHNSKQPPRPIEARCCCSRLSQRAKRDTRETSFFVFGPARIDHGKKPVRSTASSAFPYS